MLSFIRSASLDILYGLIGCSFTFTNSLFDFGERLKWWIASCTHVWLTTYSFLQSNIKSTLFQLPFATHSLHLIFVELGKQNFLLEVDLVMFWVSTKNRGLSLIPAWYSFLMFFGVPRYYVPRYDRKTAGSAYPVFSPFQNDLWYLIFWLWFDIVDYRDSRVPLTSLLAGL